jgi:SAM-dependent methyltransferase
MTDHWAQALASWAIPPEILAQAEKDPWSHPVDRFAQRADRAVTEPEGPSFERAAEVVRARPGSVLDVGAGAGAASLPLAPWATSITAVDSNPEMLAAFEHRASQLGVDHTTVEGVWPTVADQVAPHDLTVVHHVVYNVPGIVPFIRALDGASRRRVVLELPTHHPLSWMNGLWEQFHGITRPTAPTAGDLVEILSALGLADVSAEYWSIQRESGAPTTAEEAEAQAEVVTGRLCLPDSRVSEVAEALQGIDHQFRDVVTVSWTPGRS